MQGGGRMVILTGGGILPAAPIGDRTVNASLVRITLSFALGACSFAAAAQSSVGVGVSVEAGTSRDAVAEDRINAADAPATHPFCLRSTGSRIPPRVRADDAGDAKASRPACVPANGRVYTREDLRSTGEVDIADALRRLDPAIR